MDKFKPGVYRLRDKFVSAKPDKRMAGRTPVGLPKNAVILVQPWYGKEGVIEVLAPQYLYRHEGLVLHSSSTSPTGYGSAQGPDKALDADMVRLLSLLEPVDLRKDHQAWLVDFCERKHFDRRQDEILLELLRQGDVSQAQVVNTIETIEARDNAEHPE